MYQFLYKPAEKASETQKSDNEESYDIEIVTNSDRSSPQQDTVRSNAQQSPTSTAQFPTERTDRSGKPPGPLCLMAEKLGLRFCLKEALAAVDELCAELDGSAAHLKELGRRRHMTNVELIGSFRSSISLLKTQVQSFNRTNKQAAPSLSRPKARLTEQLASASQSSSVDVSLEESRERQLYIEELESQLHQARAQLLSVKL